MAIIARIAKAPELIRATYPVQDSGAANANLDIAPDGWRVDNNGRYISLPPGWYQIKIESIPGSESRFYTDVSEWEEYEGMLDKIVQINPGSRQRFWGSMTGGTLSGITITAAIQYIQPI